MDIRNLKTYYLYVNTENELFQIKETQLSMIPSIDVINSGYIIPKMSLISNIQEMKYDELGKYILSDIVLYHPIINDFNIRQFIDDELSSDFKHIPYFKEISYLSDIVLKPTHEKCYNISSLYIILKHKPTNHNNPINHNNSTIKKVRITPINKRKSIKRKYMN